MCLICQRIQQIQEGCNPYFVKELQTGYVVLGDHQHFQGYTLFLCKEHQTELFHLPPANKVKYLEAVSYTHLRVHFSCEVFPPKAFADMEQAAAVTREIAALEPDFISVTYGAAGKTPAHNLELPRVVEQCGRTVSYTHLVPILTGVAAALPR